MAVWARGGGHLGDPLDGLAVRLHQGQGRPVTLDDQLVDVGSVEGSSAWRAKSFEDQQVDPHELAHLGIVGVVERTGAEPLKQQVSAAEHDAVAATHRRPPAQLGAETL